MNDDPRTTRDRILEAALTAFAERGVEATSLDAVAVAIGIRKQTILYWFPSKDQLLQGVVDHATAELGHRLGRAATLAEPNVVAQIVAVVDATLRIATTDPALLALVRETSRLGPPASSYLADALAPLVHGAAEALGEGDEPVDRDRARTVLLGAGARVVGMATEAEIRADLGLTPDLAWLRARRRALVHDLTAQLT
ncbi:MAG: TetR/AcrR family transcriptional regulator [Aquihabitans sp.]